MPKSTNPVQTLLHALSGVARDAGWSDAEWARRSGVPKETLCRLRSRSNCDLATVAALSHALGKQLTLGEPTTAQARPRGLWPTTVDRRLETRVVDLVHSRSTSESEWRALGPAFFMGGLAVTLASVPGFDRRAYLDLAEALHPGASEPRVFERWLADTPMPPARLLPMLQSQLSHAA
jgi:DNA-binding phage protein